MSALYVADMNSSTLRTRWAAIGAAVAVTLGAGGLGIANAAIDNGEKPVFVPIEPCRMIDTRAASPLGAQRSLAFDMTTANGDCTAFPDATALSLNVTATNQTAATFLSLVPGELPAGAYNSSSNLNPVPGEPPTPNAVSVDVDNGQFSIYNNAGSVDIIIDVVGYYQDHHHDDRYYRKAIVDQLIADATPTIDAYTTSETDALIAGLQPAGDYATSDDLGAFYGEISRDEFATIAEIGPFEFDMDCWYDHFTNEIWVEVWVSSDEDVWYHNATPHTSGEGALLSTTSALSGSTRIDPMEVQLFAPEAGFHLFDDSGTSFVAVGLYAGPEGAECRAGGHLMPIIRDES